MEHRLRLGAEEGLLHVGAHQPGKACSALGFPWLAGLISWEDQGKSCENKEILEHPMKIREIHLKSYEMMVDFMEHPMK